RQVLQRTLRDALARSPLGYYWGGGALDGINRLVSYRKSADLPIILMVGLAEDDIFASYYRFEAISVSAAVLLTVLLVGAVVARVRHQRGRERSAEARLRAEEDLRRAKGFLDTIIENLPLPVVVKDHRTLRFELVNRAYEKFIGMSRQ